MQQATRSLFLLSNLPSCPPAHVTRIALQCSKAVGPLLTELAYSHRGGRPASADSHMQPTLECCGAQRFPLAWKCSVQQPCCFTTRIQVRHNSVFELLYTYFAEVLMH